MTAWVVLLRLRFQLLAERIWRSLKPLGSGIARRVAHPIAFCLRLLSIERHALTAMKHTINGRELLRKNLLNLLFHAGVIPA